LGCNEEIENQLPQGEGTLTAIKLMGGWQCCSGHGDNADDDGNDDDEYNDGRPEKTLWKMRFIRRDVHTNPEISEIKRYLPL